MAEETNEISDKRPTGWGSLPFLIDLLEPVSHFVEAVRETLTSGNQMDSDIHKAVNFYCVPLQVGLKPGGFVVLKENSKKGHYALVANLSFRLC
ncbi:alpha N-terminal protein methyltransferase 1-like isoform X4 [Prosopis cineraria]|uniref:alpha N-terminal protein methyltransferase 1-like isoform X4 n=1 Tax=Prosopis cineraria TaxID=364024 RepID=UPI00240EAAFE|nr:alpha N-terminal protein methyltransferase 1-like isoform X4 [Prosopis cineraria]